MVNLARQNESNNLAEDSEIVTKCLREDFKLRPEEDGARIIGNITVEERNRRGEWMTINCRDVGDSGYGVPYNVEEEKLRLVDEDIDFVMAIETGGMFDRLIENVRIRRRIKMCANSSKGQPARFTRRIMRRISDEWKKPIAVFTDRRPMVLQNFCQYCLWSYKDRSYF